MPHRRRLIVHAFGHPPDVTRLEPYEPAMPEAGDVRVRMRVAAVNPSDIVTIAGAYSSRTRLPFVPGFEGVGVIDAVGAQVADLRVGDRAQGALQSLRKLGGGASPRWQSTRSIASPIACAT